MSTYAPITVAQAEDAWRRLQGVAVRTPLVRLDIDARVEIFLKLENLQPIGAFKIRGAGSKLLGRSREELAAGIWTASAGNMAQGAAWCARLLGVPFTAVVPETAPEAKVSAIRRLGGGIETVSRTEFFEIFSTRQKEGMDGLFVHAFSDPEVMAGNATIGLEILEDLPAVKAVYVPYGGGGLSCGVASIIRAESPETKVITCEPETAAPLSASFAAGKRTDVEFVPSFVDGAGAPFVYPEMWELARELIAGAIAVPVRDAAYAVSQLMARGHVVAEGAGALGLAAAIKHAKEGPVVCVVSGGNINPEWLGRIISGGIPDA